MNEPDDIQVVHTYIEGVVAWLENRPNRGAKMIGIISRTKPKMLVKSRDTKEPNPFLPEGVVRVAHRTVCIGASYEAAVNRQRVSEADPMDEVEYFNAKSLWRGNGEHASDYTVRHKPTGKLYFAYRPSQDRVTGFPVTIEDKWTSAKTGEVLDPEMLKQYLPAPSKARRQEVDRPVPWRCLTLSNVQELFYSKHRFIIDQPESEVA
jgi:hypothetical protein